MNTQAHPPQPDLPSASGAPDADADLLASWRRAGSGAKKEKEKEVNIEALASNAEALRQWQENIHRLRMATAHAKPKH